MIRVSIVFIFSMPNVADQARLFAVACIRLVRAAEPEEDISSAGLADVCGNQFVGVAHLK